MRTFEIILILLNLIAIYCGLKKVSKTVWLGVSGASAVALILHAILEGLRWQMAVSYIFTMLIIMYALAKATGKFSAIKPLCAVF